MPDVRLMTYAPGHFHAALIQKEMYPGVSPQVHVYAPLGADLLAHLGRVAAFNGRAERPTSWELEVHASPNSLDRMLSERPGNVAIISGRNRGKIDAILATLEAGIHVLADKPWVIDPENLPRLAAALDLAEQRRLVAMDVMTERWEVTTRIQRALMQDPDVFGTIDPGTEERPGMFLESEHFLCKHVAGNPLRRPSWFFDVDQQGEGLSDVGTHLVDLVPWLLWPDQPVGPEDVQILRAGRSPTALSRSNFQKVTGEPDFPEYLQNRVHSSHLLYYCNSTISYVVKGIHVWMNVAWGFEAGPGQADRHLCRCRGSRAYVEVRQGAAEHFRPEVYVVPRSTALTSSVATAVERCLARLQPRYPGVRVEESNGLLRLEIPNRLRDGREAHFGEVARVFLEYLEDPTQVPAWEKTNMLGKYHVTTQGVRLARKSS